MAQSDVRDEVVAQQGDGGVPSLRVAPHVVEHEVVDRLVHHGMVFEFSGESHRLRTRQAAGRSSKTG